MFFISLIVHNGGEDNMDKKEVINIRCTEFQKSKIHKEAEKRQMNVSEYLLTKALEKPTENKVSTGEITDWVDNITTINELYHLLLKTGDEVQIAEAKKLLAQRKEDTKNEE